MKFSLIILMGALGLWASMTPAIAQGDPKKGKYIMRMGGCESCHKTPKVRNADLAGGLEMQTEFGTFHVPNITPDPETGIGGWTDEQFITAMTKGIAPDGSHYYPAFPYTSYTKMSRQDLLDLKAYLDSVEPQTNNVPDHELRFPYNQRFLMVGWKWLYFDEGAFTPNPDKSASWNRGAYIVQSAAHCAECHSPRNRFGALLPDQKYTGNPKGPGGEKIPAMLVNWEQRDLFRALRIGMKPDGMFMTGSMSLVIGKTSSKLSREDLKAVTDYILDQ